MLKQTNETPKPDVFVIPKKSTKDNKEEPELVKMQTEQTQQSQPT